MKTSLIIAICGAILFAARFIYLLIGEFNLWPLIFCVICCVFIYKGSKTVAFKTTTGVFSKITQKYVGHMDQGSLNWADPMFEVVTINVDGSPNISLDLQELKIEVLSTPDMHTKVRGIRAKVKNIVFMLEIIEDEMPYLFEIEGGGETIKKRILSFINLFFLDEIGKIDPVDLDEDKGEILKKLASRLKRSVNSFCKKNHYPYKIPNGSIATIGDTELETKYYEVLAKKEFTKLEQDGFDVEAERIRERLLTLGNALLPTATDNEKLKAAMVAIKITPKTIEEKTFGVNTEISALLKELADILKNKFVP
ncbi:MAG TPA: hypothetical protein VK153_02150 [Candidatus Paceibacterota bacterium]|nr:hypothetical protein [Candidatus Paceibacterota bacterium]